MAKLYRAREIALSVMVFSKSSVEWAARGMLLTDISGRDSERRISPGRAAWLQEARSCQFLASCQVKIGPFGIPRVQHRLPRRLRVIDGHCSAHFLNRQRSHHKVSLVQLIKP
jgi:hypothetical protein